MPACVCPDGCRSYCTDRCAGDEPPGTVTECGLPAAPVTLDSIADALAEVGPVDPADVDRWIAGARFDRR